MKLEYNIKNNRKKQNQCIIEKFVDKKHPLRKEIKKMLNQKELMEALFPKQVAEMKKELIQLQNELIQKQNKKIQMQNELIQIVRNMKDHGDDLEYISKITNIPLEKIKEI